MTGGSRGLRAEGARVGAEAAERAGVGRVEIVAMRVLVRQQPFGEEGRVIGLAAGGIGVTAIVGDFLVIDKTVRRRLDGQPGVPGFERQIGSAP